MAPSTSLATIVRWVALVTMGIAATVNWRVLMFPGTLVAVAAGLFWWRGG